VNRNVDRLVKIDDIERGSIKPSKSAAAVHCWAFYQLSAPLQR